MSNRESTTQHAKTHVKWYQLSTADVFKKMKSSPKGLSAKEAHRRITEHGPNKLPEGKKVPYIALFFRQFKSAFVYILLIAALVSFFLGEAADSIVILAVVIINVIVGFIQEAKAQRALEALQKVIVQHALVVRDGNIHEIKTDHLVPGDVIYLEEGAKVPADGRIFEVRDFAAEEAVLTGESEPVAKDTKTLKGDLVLGDQKNMVFLGTVAARGTMRAIVTATGSSTALGSIAHMVDSGNEEPTPLQQKLNKFSKILAVLLLSVSVGIFGYGLLLGHEVAEMFTTAVAVAVSAIPESLLITVTVVLAVGMRRILKRKGLVKKLLSAETLGSTSVICVDKTGTLTAGKMSVARIVSEKDTHSRQKRDGRIVFSATSAEEFALSLRIAALCNNAIIENPKASSALELTVKGDTTERALLAAAWEVGLSKDMLEKEIPRLDEVPFSSERKSMMTLHSFSNEENIVYLKGSPETVIGDLSGFIFDRKSKGSEIHKQMTPEYKKSLLKKADDLSREGLRVLAVGYKKVSHDTKKLETDLTKDGFIFVAFIGLRDEPRLEVAEVLEATRAAGIQTVMITGDHKLTAKTIGQELGFPVGVDNILEGDKLAKISESQLKKLAPKISIYSRVAPQDKLKIVKAWQDRDAVVAMTGDGVNDAPALQAADIGVAPGSGTDVAKEAADVILLDNNFSTIVAAVRQGRVIYDNIKKVILMLLSDSFTEMIMIISSLVMGWPLPLLASQILWINLVDDSFPALALTQDPEESGIMSEKPRPRNAPFLDSERKVLIGLISVVSAIMALFAFWWSGQQGYDLDHSRTMAFAIVATSTLVYVFGIKSLRRPVWRAQVFNNPLLVMAVVLGFVLQVVAVYWNPLQNLLHTTALSLSDWALILGMDLALLAIVEITKGIFLAKEGELKLLKP